MKKRKFLGIATILVIIFAAVIEYMTIYELDAYESAFLEVYADEQDGYVNLTLDQIDRLGASATEDNITAVIASLDATASKYWTLSTGDNILFIKSVTETNRYKNFSADSYYTSTSAVDFVSSLKLGEVSHAVINLDDGTYVASGGLFSWQDETYRICLLTYDRAIMDQNAILEAKNAIIVFMTVTLALFLSFVIILTSAIDKRTKTISNLEQQQIYLNQQIDKLDSIMVRYQAYDASLNVYSLSILGEFLEALDEKNIEPLHLALFTTNTRNQMLTFMEEMVGLLDQNVLRFQVSETEILLIFSGFPYSAFRSRLEVISQSEVSMVASATFDSNYRSYLEQFNKFWEAEGHEPIEVVQGISSEGLS